MSQTDHPTPHAAEKKAPTPPPEQFEEVDIGDEQQDPTNGSDSGNNQSTGQGTTPP